MTEHTCQGLVPLIDYVAYLGPQVVTQACREDWLAAELRKCSKRDEL